MAKQIQHISFKSGFELNSKLNLTDQKIEKLISYCKMPSDFIELDYQAKPSFLESLQYYGKLHDIVTIEPSDFDGLSLMGVRSMRPAYINGLPSEVGYLHHLRVHPEKRGGTTLARGYKKLRKVFAESDAKVTITSILEDNHAARSVLEINRGGFMPNYDRVSRFLTAIIPLRGIGKRWPVKKRERNHPWNLTSRRLNEKDISDLIDLFNTAGSVNDGLSVLNEADFFDTNGYVSSIKGLSISDFIGVFSGNRLMAAAGIWDQSALKQIVITNLSNAIKAGQSLWNLGRKILGECPIPPVGSNVSFVLLDTWVSMPGAEREIMPYLLRAATIEAKKSGASFAAWGVPEKHPAIIAVRTLFYIPYWSIIYKVSWPENLTYQFGQKQLQLINLGAL